jgi:hypothetical protein
MDFRLDSKALQIFKCSRVPGPRRAASTDARPSHWQPLAGLSPSGLPVVHGQIGSLYHRTCYHVTPLATPSHCYRDCDSDPRRAAADIVVLFKLPQKT